MKIIIYIICFFAMILIQVFAKNSGVLLGAIPMMLLYLVTFGIAKGLCKLWDNRTQNKNIEFDDEATVYGNFDNYVSHTNSSHKSNKKTIVIIAVIVILVLAVLIICFSMFNDKESTEFEKTQLDVVTDTSSNEKNDRWV